MSRSFDALIERQMRKAQAQGQFENMSGAGKPLPENFAVRGATASVNQTMAASAGIKPRQFSIKERLDAARKELREETDADAKKKLMAKVTQLELEYNIEREAYSNFMK